MMIRRSNGYSILFLAYFLISSATNFVDTEALTSPPRLQIRNRLSSSHLSLRRINVRDRSVGITRGALTPFSSSAKIQSHDKKSDASILDSRWVSLCQLLRFKLSKRIAVGLGMIMLIPLKASASTVITETVAPIVTEAAVPAISLLSPISAAVEFQLSLRLVYAALLGAGLGKERSIAKHSAGVRTMALVAMGASAFTVCSVYGFGAGGRHDPSRMASNVASGVGFVGAGVITTTHFSGRNIVHGLTTAATIWLSAAVGVACGTGLHQIATMAAALTLFILRMGRSRPKEKGEGKSSTIEHETEHQALRTSRFQHYDDDEDDVEDDDDDNEEDAYAETHDTSEWDEHYGTMIDDERSDLPETHQGEEDVNERRSSGTKTIVVRKSADVDEIVMNAWNNTEHPHMHVDNMQIFSTAPVNQTVYGP